MRSLFALVGAATIAFLGAGWYLGWYEITRKHTPDGGSLQLNINTDKTVEGIGEIGGKIKKIGENILDKRDGNAPSLTTPAGPASSFFSPEPTPSAPPAPATNGGWKSIVRPSKQTP